MATTDDTLSITLAGGKKIPLLQLPSDGEVSSEHVISTTLSTDGRYMIQSIVRIIDLDAVNKMKKQEQLRGQAHFIRDLFSQYVDFTKREAFCNLLAEKLFAGKIEWQTDPMGNGYVNIAKSKGQTDFFHLLLEHMNPQKLKTLHNEDGLRNFKQVLKKNVRHLGKVLNNKSLGVTLHRLIDKT